MRDTTPKYIVVVTVPGYTNTIAAWGVRGKYGVRGYGAPTTNNLRKYVEAFNKSTLPGGSNAHLGLLGVSFKVAEAAIYLNDVSHVNSGHATPLATWKSWEA